MKMTMKRAVCLLFCVLMLAGSLTVAAVAKLPSPSRYFYVYDEPNVLTLTTEDHIIRVNETLYDACGAQIVVACVSTTGDEDIADYAVKLFNKWKIGSSDQNNGVLVLLSVDEDDYYALQGKGLENLLSSGTIKLMLDQYLEPYFAAGDYDGGARSIFDALAKFVSEIYNVSVLTGTEETASVPATAAAETATTTKPQQTTLQPSGGFFDGFSFLGSVWRFLRGIRLRTWILIAIVILILRGILKNKGSASHSSASHSGGWILIPALFHLFGSIGSSFGGRYGGSSRGGFSGGFSGRPGGGRSGGFGAGRSRGFGSGGHSGGGGFSRGGGAGRR